MSNFLAECWGVTIVVVSLALLTQPKLLKKLFVSAENKGMMSFWGMITLVIGVAMVLVHNVWVLDWRVVITIIGWLTLIKGVDLLLLPKRMKRRWAKMKSWQWRLVFGFLLLVGLMLTYLGIAV